MTKALGGASMKDIISGIYEIKNIVNGNNYIGSAINIYKRWGSHKDELRKQNHKNKHLQNAWNKYGEDSFCFSILEMCNPAQTIEREQHYIDTINPVYNIARVAGSTLGKKHTDEAKNKMRASQLGRKPSSETRKKMSEAGKGRLFSEQHREKLSKAGIGNKNGIGNHAGLGRKHTEEQRMKMSFIRKIICNTEEFKQKVSQRMNGNKHNIGRKHTDEARRKMSEAHKNISDETRRKLSEAQKARYIKKLVVE